MFEGIDVSKHNGIIDWKKVAAAKKFAFIRVGWAGYDGRIVGNGGLDSMFHTNMKSAISAGIDVGIYVYSYCQTAAAAKVAAKETLELVKPYTVTYPIAFDIEDNQYCSISQKANNTAIAKAFLSEIEASKYYGVLYSYKSFVLSYLNMSELAKYDFWLAHYTAKTDYTGKYGIWQHHGDVAGYIGSCPGVNGACDLNTAYKDYSTLIKNAGLNNLQPVKVKTAEEITVDNMISDGVTTDSAYWLNVLKGQATASASNIKSILDKYHNKMKG